MTNRQIEASREARLWISQVIIPVVTIAGTALAIPEVRETVVTKVKSAKSFINKKIKQFKKEDEES